MIRWCAYCQSFLGERPPYEDLGFTHGVCDACLGLFDTPEDDDFAPIEALKRFHDRLREAGERGDLDAAIALMAQARAAGLKTTDLLLGLVGPILYEVGSLWAAKRITVADEHRFTRFYRRVVAALRDAALLPEGDLEREETDMLLVLPKNNAHVFGVELLASWLRDRGLRVAQVRADATPKLEAVIAVKRPRCIGISVALASQLPEVEAIVARAARASNGIARIVVGGQAVKAGEVTVGPPALALSDPMALLELLRGAGPASPSPGGVSE